MTLGEAFLLDTSTLLYWLAGDERVPMRVRQAVDEAGSRVYFSPLNLAEIQIKYQAGKLRLPGTPEAFLSQELKKYPFQWLDLSAEAIYTLQKLPPLHRDPFDRLLIAQALTLGAILVTPDEQIRKYPIRSLWD